MLSLANTLANTVDCQLLNEMIIPAKSKYDLIRPHLITLVPNSNMIEVILFPLGGGQYHIPVAVEDKTITNIIKEINDKYQNCLLMDQM